MAHVRQELALGPVGGFGGILGLLQRLFGIFSFGDVGKDAVCAKEAIAHAGCKRAIVDPDPVLVFGADSVFNVKFFIFSEERLVAKVDIGRVVGMDLVEPELAFGSHEFLGGVTEGFFDVVANIY